MGQYSGVTDYFAKEQIQCRDLYYSTISKVCLLCLF